MVRKLRKLADVVAAFVAAYPGPGARCCREWMTDWRACYPQFEDEILAEATDLIFGDLDGQAAATLAPQPASASREAMSSHEMEEVRLRFVGLDDPTPEELAEWRASHPAMADELVALATALSTSAYLRTPPLPPTDAEVAAERRQIARLAAQIASGTVPEPRAKRAARSGGSPPAGAGLRSRRVAALDHYHSEVEARRKPGGTAR